MELTWCKHYVRAMLVPFGTNVVETPVVLTWNGGSWLDNDKKRVQTGDQVLSLIDEHSGEFYHNLFGGSRNLAEQQRNWLYLTFHEGNHVRLLQEKRCFWCGISSRLRN
ncbi:hypothetical protein A0J61_11121 [Choanephora cucurbitarum]|uniref:Uncharacterized protein n=1 Tax=Choanephora cucurbitarum TaxID=101091 RepID=A0A1C7MVK2_9FUNG|nr:hypothetical protein A0J61_11121 [Choanephora cucurbitarum]